MSGPSFLNTPHDVSDTPFNSCGDNLPALGISRSITYFGIRAHLLELAACQGRQTGDSSTFRGSALNYSAASMRARSCCFLAWLFKRKCDRDVRILLPANFHVGINKIIERCAVLRRRKSKIPPLGELHAIHVVRPEE